MNKKVFLAGAAIILAGAGIYKYIGRQRDKQTNPAENWTTDNIPDLAGKVIIVTGANNGIGYEAAKEFARNGAQTIMACRNLEKAQAALDQIKIEIPDTSAEIMQLDLASLASVHRFADEFKTKYDHLDVLLNNAGIMGVPYSRTVDGFEKHFGINYLGHFALTGLLIDVLIETPCSRVVTVSSIGHRISRMDFNNLMYENGKRYLSVLAYGRSKLANLLFTYELQRRFDDKDIDAIAVAAHPGTSYTNLSAHLKGHPVYKYLEALFDPITQSAAMGTLSSIRAAVDPNVTGGQFFGPSGTMQTKGTPIQVFSNKASYNLADAQQLWTVSEALTGVRYHWGDQEKSIQ